MGNMVLFDEPCNHPDVAGDSLLLAPNEVHLWRVSLDLPEARIEALAQTLSEGERARAGQFVFVRDRKRFIAGRGLLRVLLGRYLQRAPETLQFRYGPYGKPALNMEGVSSPLCFNIAHSGGLALYAFVWGHAVGVDLEQQRTVSYRESIVRRFFTPHEQETFFALPENQRQEGFFNCWTRKEAYLKACGRGLSQSTGRVEVSLVPGEPAALLALAGDTPQQWSIWSSSPAPGYQGALVVAGRNWQGVTMAIHSPRSHAQSTISSPS